MTAATVASELYHQHKFYRDLVLDSRQLGRPPVDFVRMHQPPFEAVDPASDFVCFAVDLAPGFSDFEVDYGDGLKTLCATPKDFGYVNPTETQALYRTRVAADMLFLSAPVPDIAKSLEFDNERLRIELRPLYNRIIDNRWYLTQALSLWELARSEGAFSALAVEHGFLALVARLLSEADIVKSRVRLAAPAVGQENKRIGRVCEYIEASINRPLTLAELAGVANLSSYHFCRVFKAAVGMTPQAYVMERRTARAMQLLGQTNQSITEIAVGCGFASSQHFASAFRKRTGMTPRDYRLDITS
ncbi:MAG: AraC family transcriptional regulator [Pseudomonadota bacterium]